MNDLLQQIRNEKKRLHAIIRTLEARSVSAPEGFLRIIKTRAGHQYYQSISGVTDRNGKYIPRSNESLIKGLAQKTYDARVLRTARKQLAQLEALSPDYSPSEIESLYLRESPERKQLITPIEPTWEMLLNDWEQTPHTGKSFDDGLSVILTEKGERVRSKSEKILADFFFRKGIPYKYEKPLILKGYGTVYPDFTFFSKKTHSEIYWEHEGRMDDPIYARNAVKKINLYVKNGILPGEKLILTYETESTVLNTDQIEIYANKYLF